MRIGIRPSTPRQMRPAGLGILGQCRKPGSGYAVLALGPRPPLPPTWRHRVAGGYVFSRVQRGRFPTGRICRWHSRAFYHAVVHRIIFGRGPTRSRSPIPLPALTHPPSRPMPFLPFYTDQSARQPIIHPPAGLAPRQDPPPQPDNSGIYSVSISPFGRSGDV